MAAEQRRDGGRSIPLAADNWRPGHRRRKKHFGIRITQSWPFWKWLEGVGAVHAGFRASDHTQWYATEKARDQASVAAQSERRVTAVQNIRR